MKTTPKVYILRLLLVYLVVWPVCVVASERIYFQAAKQVLIKLQAAGFIIKTDDYRYGADRYSAGAMVPLDGDKLAHINSLLRQLELYAFPPKTMYAQAAVMFYEYCLELEPLLYDRPDNPFKRTATEQQALNYLITAKTMGHGTNYCAVIDYLAQANLEGGFAGAVYHKYHLDAQQRGNCYALLSTIDRALADLNQLLLRCCKIRYEFIGRCIGEHLPLDEIIKGVEQHNALAQLAIGIAEPLFAMICYDKSPDPTFMHLLTPAVSPSPRQVPEQAPAPVAAPVAAPAPAPPPVRPVAVPPVPKTGCVVQ